MKHYFKQDMAVGCHGTVYYSSSDDTPSVIANRINNALKAKRAKAGITRPIIPFKPVAKSRLTKAELYGAIEFNCEVAGC